MKIYFGLGYLEDKTLELAKTWQDIKNSKLAGPTYNQYQVFKLLEKNEPFWKEIVKSRKKLDIPSEGYSWELISALRSRPIKESPLIDEYFKSKRDDHYTLKQKEEIRIKRAFHLHPFVENEINDLIESNFILTYPMDSIAWGSSEYDEDNDELIDNPDEISNPQDISIFIMAKVTKNQLLRFVETHWDEIDKLNQKLPSPNSLTLSKKDQRIYRLRQDGLTYSQTADKIIKEFDPENIEGLINQDSVKTSYHRTLSKIASVATPRKRNKKAV